MLLTKSQSWLSNQIELLTNSGSRPRLTKRRVSFRLAGGAVRPPTAPAMTLPPSSSATERVVQIYNSSSGVITPFWREKYERDARKYWDIFYKRHENRFFKDRHYLDKEWGHYFEDLEENHAEVSLGEKNIKKKAILEVGCGAGNTVFPLIATFQNIFVHGCDFSQRAIDLVKAHKDFKEDRINAFVCDLTQHDLREKVLPSSVDIVTMIFMLSAVAPEKMPLVLQNIKRILKPTGYILLRDYAVGDLAQERLTTKDQKISENFYVRGDGTRAFYFSEDYLLDLFMQSGFINEELTVYCKQVENRSRGIVMDRRWIQGVFRSVHCPGTRGSSAHKSNCQAGCSIHEKSGSEGHVVKKKSADLANEVDICDSFALAMFDISTAANEATDITIGEHNFKIKVLSKEFQHTCKSTGLMLWESARLMSSILAENPWITRSKRILELGCGSTGICSMIAGKSAELVVATDGDQASLDLLDQNIASNMHPPFSTRMTWRRLEWGNKDDISSIKELNPQGFDVIIGTDVTYVSDAILPLFETASLLITRKSTGHGKPNLILCHVLRRVDEGSILFAASQTGFSLIDAWPCATKRGTPHIPDTTPKSSGIISEWLSGKILESESHTSALNIMCFEFGS